jgi:hypothetical protein
MQRADPSLLIPNIPAEHFTPAEVAAFCHPMYSTGSSHSPPENFDTSNFCCICYFISFSEKIRMK